MTWSARLALHYTRERDPDRCVGRGMHEGPLRLLRSLYPEGPSVCHHVLVHPPGGIVGGDQLALHATLEADTHAVITTPGATRFYRSNGDAAGQTLKARLDAGARLEWLPLETLVHDGALAANRLRFELAPGAECIGWDLLALGLPAAGESFQRGRFDQDIELAVGASTLWQERTRLDHDDPRHAARTRRRLVSPLGWGGHAAQATLWFAAGSPITEARREALLDPARAQGDAAGLPSGCSAPNPHVVVLRALAPRVEPLLQHLRAVWADWRRIAWGMAPCAPRIWHT